MNAAASLGITAEPFGLLVCLSPAKKTSRLLRSLSLFLLYIITATITPSNTTNPPAAHATISPTLLFPLIPPAPSFNPPPSPAAFPPPFGGETSLGVNCSTQSKVWTSKTSGWVVCIDSDMFLLPVPPNMTNCPSW